MPDGGFEVFKVIEANGDDTNPVHSLLITFSSGIYSLQTLRRLNFAIFACDFHAKGAKNSAKAAKINTIDFAFSHSTLFSQISLFSTE